VALIAVQNGPLSNKELAMTLRIEAPTVIETPLYESRLEISEGGEERRHTFIQQQLSEMAPVVTLGQPQYWNLASMASEKNQSLPAEMKLLLDEADFYVLQIASSFRPQREARVKWARVDIYMQPISGQIQPLAFDLYPREIYNEKGGDSKITIEPSFSFGAFGTNVESKLGQALTTIDFRRVEPVVVAYGLLQPNCGWDYQRSHQNPLEGIQVGYLIVKKPRSAEAVRMVMDVRAEVSTPSGLFGMRVTEQDQSQRTVVVCRE
jgi:hypothetical protein